MRPREKLIELGTNSLTDAEVLAIFLRTGVKGLPVNHLAQQLLQQFKNLRGLIQAPKEEIFQIKGLGQAKYAQIQAALELARRYFAEDLAGQDILKNPEATKVFLKSKLHHHQEEVFAAVFLNNSNQVICFQELFKGSISMTQIHPRVLIKQALRHNASALILAHNHPSGSSIPSDVDIETTKHLKAALALVEVKLLDHFIIGDKVVSLAELGHFVI